MSTREEYIDKLEKQLREWNDQIDQLKEKADTESQQIKDRINERLDDLKVKRAELKVKLDRIKNSGGETFDKVKSDTEKLWGDVKEGVSDIKSILSD